MCRESDLFMKIKTAELTGKALNYAVAVAEGYTVRNNPTFDGKLKSGFWVEVKKPKAAPWLELNWLNYCVAWSYGGQIIERGQLTVEPIYWKEELIHWSAYGHNLKYDEQGEYIEGSDHKQTGPTPLIAAMRCYVASKLGTEVEIPYALL